MSAVVGGRQVVFGLVLVGVLADARRAPFPPWGRLVGWDVERREQRTTEVSS